MGRSNEAAAARRKLTAEQQQLVISNQPLAFQLANTFIRLRKIKHHSLLGNEIIDAMTLGLVRAAQGFKPELGLEFGSYLGPVVHNHMSQCLAAFSKRGMRGVPKHQIVRTVNCDFSPHFDEEAPRSIEPIAREPAPAWLESDWQSVVNRIDAHTDELTKIIVYRHYRLGQTRQQIVDDLDITMHRVNQVLKNLHNNHELQAALANEADWL